MTTMALSKYTVSKDNNFNLIRFIAATLVLYSHSFPLTATGGGYEPLFKLVGMSWGSVAVDAFFVTSGFLIASSFFERKSFLAFIWARILRIYPALILAVLFCALIVGAMFTTYGLSSYLSDPQTHGYILKNSYLLSGVKFSLPGVFADNPYKNAVNGSLWTLPYEIKMYALLALIGSVVVYVQKYLGKPLLKVFFLVMTVIVILLNIVYHFQNNTTEHSVRFFAAFFAGASFYLYREHVFLSSKAFLMFGALLLFSSIQQDLFFVVYSLSLPYLLLYLAYVPSGMVRGFNKMGDYSYGIYIYAFPVQQSVAAMMPHISVQAMAVTSFVITFLLAFGSWHGVEKKCLKMKGRYVVIEEMLRNLRLTITAALAKG